MEVALECIYSCERDDQLSLCYEILECLPQRGYGSDARIHAHKSHTNRTQIAHTHDAVHDNAQVSKSIGHILVMTEVSFIH